MNRAKVPVKKTHFSAEISRFVFLVRTHRLCVY